MRKIFCGVAAVVLSILIFSCGSTPKQDAAAEESDFTADPSQAVSISVPVKKGKSFFAGVNPEAVAAVENGSPASINYAYSLLRKDAAQYTDAEKILINTGYSLMKILWPEEYVSFESFEMTADNPYLGAIESARRGIYDESTGNSDFLTLVLPSIVLVTSTSREDYYGESQSALEAALKLNGDSVLANYLYGILCRRQNNYKKAHGYLKNACENSSECIETLYAYADINYKNGNYADSILLSKQILVKNQFYRPALKLCAEACFVAGNLDESESYVGRVLQQEPENSYYVLFRARILIQKGEYIRAASLLDVYARTDSTNREYLLLKTKVQKDWNKNTTAASNTIEQALVLYPEDKSIILTAAGLAAETGNRIGGKTAGELASIILQEDKSNVEALQIQVNELVAKKQWTQAYSVSSSLRQLKNAPGEAVYTHVTICLNSGHKDEAWNIASSMYNANPRDENVLQNYIRVLVSTGRSAEALRIIEAQMEGATAKMKSFLWYEKSFLSASEDATLSCLRASLTANPRNKDALFRLYQLYFNKKEYRKAQYYLKQVVALSPADESLLKLNTELETLLSK